MATQPPQQSPRYTTTVSPVLAQRLHSAKPAQDFQGSQYVAQPQIAQTSMPFQPAPPTQTPTDPLEQRILDLLYPYRDECFEADFAGVTAEQERKALILCENIAFLIRHNQSSYGRAIDPNDVSMSSRNWHGMKQGNGPAGIGVFVNGNGYTHTVIRVQVLKWESAVERFTASVDQLMVPFFPNPS